MGTRVSAPVSAPAPPLAPPRRFPVSPGLDLVVSSLHRLIGSPHNEAAFPTSRAPPPPRHHQTSPPLRLPVSPFPRLAVSSGLDLVVSSSHRLIGTPHNEAAFPTSRAPPPPRHHQTSPVPHPLFLSFSLWRRDAGSGVQVGALERPGIVPIPGLRCIPTAYSTATLVWTMPSACRSSSRSRTSDSRVARSTSYSVSSRSQICSGVTGVSESISQMRAPTSSSP